MFGLFNKVGSALASSVIALILHLGHYDRTLAVQPESAEFAIRFALAGVCFICSAIGFAAMLFYPISREQMRQITEKLAIQRETR